MKAGSRLAEMLGILRKHHITRGMDPVKFREILEDLGPTFVKAGQIMSMRSDLLPEEYCKELERLRTDVSPMPFSAVRETIAAELGRAPEEVFERIDEVPLGAASIAQVHAALLRETPPEGEGESLSRRVVIKVQRPQIRETMANDIALMRKAAGLVNLKTNTGDLLDFRAMVEEMWKTSQEEMDFQREAENLDRFQKNRKGIVYLTSPVVVHAYTTQHMLVMSDVQGIQIDRTEELTDLGYDLSEIGSKTAESYCKQVLDDGFFNADPHPGNLRIADGKIAWIDFGMVGTVSANLRSIMKNAVNAVIAGDIYELENLFLMVGEAKEPVNRAQLYAQIDEIVRRYRSMDFGSIRMGPLLEECLEVIRSNKIAIPSELTLLCRSMVTVEGTITQISPDVNLMEILKQHMKQEMRDDFDLKNTVEHGARELYASSRKSLGIPAQVSDLLNLAKSGQLTVNVSSPDDREQRRNLLTAANRLCLAVLVLALLTGSTILMTASASTASAASSLPQWFGVPWPAAAGFFLAAAITVYLLIKIFRTK